MRLITAGSSMHAITFICPPQVSQVSMSILNTRFKRCAHVIDAWRLTGDSSVLTEERVRAALESLVRANDDSARQPATWFEMQCELIPITPNPRIEGEAFRSTAATRTSCQSREIS